MYPTPIHVGAFDPVCAGDIVDLYVDFAADLGDGDTLTTVELELQDGEGEAVAGAVTAHTETAGRCDFRLQAPETAGWYVLVAQLTLSDGQELTHTASLRVA